MDILLVDYRGSARRVRSGHGADPNDATGHARTVSSQQTTTALASRNSTIKYARRRSNPITSAIPVSHQTSHVRQQSGLAAHPMPRRQLYGRRGPSTLFVSQCHFERITVGLEISIRSTPNSHPGLGLRVQPGGGANLPQGSLHSPNLHY